MAKIKRNKKWSFKKAIKERISNKCNHFWIYSQRDLKKTTFPVRTNKICLYCGKEECVLYARQTYSDLKKLIKKRSFTGWQHLGLKNDEN